MSSSVLLLATRSAGKLGELRPMFADAGVRAIDLVEAGIEPSAAEDTLEEFDAFEENALAKARYFQRVSGMPTVADDSGLEVAILGGAPGVRSKRWSGRKDLSGAALDQANNQALLAAMADQGDRRARYVCVAAFVDDDREVSARGEASGHILTEPRGRGGFGYDPLFLSDELGITFGEADRDVKAAVSHRGKAFRQLFAALARGR